MTASDKVFGGSIPAFYDTYLVPLIFEAYADDLLDHVTDRATQAIAGGSRTASPGRRAQQH